MIRMVLAAAALAACTLGGAIAQETPDPVEAVAALETRAEPGQRWSFTRTMTRGDQSFSASYDPSRPAGELWRLVAPPSVDMLPEELRATFEAFADEETPDLDVVLGGDDSEEGGLDEIIGDDFALISDDGAQAVFAFSPGEAPQDEGGFGAMAEHIAGELTVDVAAEMIRAIRFFAPESFKPNPAARISALDITMQLGEAAPGGPIAVVATDTHVAGSALFREFNETISVTNADFARVAVEPDPQQAE